MPHVGDPENLGLQRALPGIDDEAATFEPVVQAGVVEAARQPERGQGVGAQPGRQQAGQPQFVEAVPQQLGRGAVAPDAARGRFVQQLVERGVERVPRRHRGRERNAGLLLCLPVQRQMQIQRTPGIGRGVLLHGLHRLVTDQHERYARLPLDTFVGRAGAGVHAAACQVEGLPAQRADRVEQEDAARPADERPDLGDGIEQAGRGLVMDQCHRGDLRISVECRGKLRQVWRLRPGPAQFDGRDAVRVGHLPHAVAVHAVVDDQQLAAFGNARGDHCFDRQRARAA